MKRTLLLFSFLFALITAFTAGAQSSAPAKDLNCRDLVTRTLKSIREVKTLKYHLKVIERGKKGYNFFESSVKFHRHPRKIYLYIKGIEVLWVHGTNDGKALVKPNAFPFFNLNLDPMGNLMRQDQHHTIFEMGYDYFAGIIQFTMDRLDDRFNEYFTCTGEEKINNRRCYKVVINNPDFTYVDYRVGEGESITSIARKLHISEYMIVEKNPRFNDYFDILKKGQVIKVPNWYARTVVIYIDQLYLLPVSVRVDDEKGLFEEYNYHHLLVNPKFSDEEFTRDYKDYGF